MKRLHVTNYTMNSNLAVYIGAYTDNISNLAILDFTPQHKISYIVPYLKQMRIAYRIYSNENTFMQDKNYFHPDAVLFNYDAKSSYKKIEKVVTISKINAIIITTQKCICFKQGWYSVSIYNPAVNQTTYLYHTNDQKNIPILRRLDDYQSIRVEWLPEIF